MADFTKTGIQVDEWAIVSAGTQRKGNEIAIPDDMQITIIVPICKIEAVAHDGECIITIEASEQISGDETWVDLLPLKINAETASATTLDAEAAAGATTIPIAATAGFTVKGDKYFIKNGTIANSEIVRNNGYSDGVSITTLRGLTNTQQNGVSIHTSVEDFVFTIPSPFRRVVVLVNNKDADCDVVSMTRIAKVTDLE